MVFTIFVTDGTTSNTNGNPVYQNVQGNPAFISSDSENIQDGSGNAAMNYTRINREDTPYEEINPYDELHGTTTTTGNAEASSTYQNVQDNPAFADIRNDNIQDGSGNTAMQYTSINRMDVPYEVISPYDQLQATVTSSTYQNV